MPSIRSVSRRSALKAGIAASATGLLMPGTAAAATTRPEVTERLRDMERRHGARLGVYGHNTRTGETVSYRGGERFAMCSVFKGLVAAHVLRDHDRHGEFLERVVQYTKDDLQEWSIITEHFVSDGMAIRDLCIAAMCYSDNTAANLLLRETGGPRALTKFCRAIGDRYTRLDRVEPELNTATPGDPRDTTTPEAIARSYGRLVLGRTLARRDRDLLTSWLKTNTTSAKRFRAGLPDDWVVGDKTGNGGYGTVNDVGIVWTAKRTPLVLAVLTTHDTEDASEEEDLVADATRLLQRAIAPHG